jgi:hypothetical protein
MNSGVLYILICLFAYFLMTLYKLIIAKKKLRMALPKDANDSVLKKELEDARKLFNIGFIAGSIAIIGFMYSAQDMIKSKKIDFSSASNIKNMSDLEKYIDYSAESSCRAWQKACNYNNQSKRWQEQVFEDEQIQNFYMSTIRIVIQKNDLPDSYEQIAIDRYRNKMQDCGWSYEREKWPGRN